MKIEPKQNEQGEWVCSSECGFVCDYYQLSTDEWIGNPLYPCIPALRRDRDQALAERDELQATNERLITSRAAIAEEQVILRKDLDEAQRHWDKAHRQVEPLQAENTELKLEICTCRIDCDKNPHDYAKQRGWPDIFEGGE